MSSLKNIRELAFNVKNVFEEMGVTFSSYQASTNLPCLTGCGRCCLNPEIEATILEMIPVALRIYDEGQLDEWLDKIETSEQDHCLFFQNDGEGKGRCQNYSDRPAVCRMFGVAGYYSKNKTITLSICKYITDQNPTLSQQLKNNPDPENTPIISLWNSHLLSFGTPDLNQKFPINIALKKAMHKVALAAQYQLYDDS